MNQKLAKMLRLAAKYIHDTLPEKGAVGTYLQHQKTGVIINARNSPRGIYRRLKRTPGVRTLANQVLAEQRALPKLP